MNNLINKVIVLALTSTILLSGCGISPLTPPISNPTATSTPAPTSTSTSTPTFTPTPIPVSIKDAIAQGTLSEIKTFGKGTIQQSIFSPDGSLFIAVTSRGIYIYDTKDWQEIKYIPASVEKKVNAIDISADGEFFAVGDSAGDVTFWDTETWEMLKSIKVYEGQITSLKISPDGLNFVAIGDKKLISTWDLNNGTLINSQEQKEIVGSVNYSSDGQWILTSAFDQYKKGDMLVRKVSSLEIASRIRGISEFMGQDYAISPFENIMVRYSFFDGMYIQELDTKNFLSKKFPVEFQHEYIEYWIFLDKYQLVAKVLHSSDFYLINLQTYNMEKISASQLASIAGNNPRAWSVTKEREIQSLGFESGLYVPKFITPDGNILVLQGWYPNSIGVIKLGQGNSMVKSMPMDFDYLTMKNKNPVVIKWNPKEKQGNFTITEIDANDVHILSETQFKYDVDNAIQRVALSNNGTLLAAGTESGTLYLWDINKKAQIARFHAHTPMSDSSGGHYAFNKISFSSDDSLVAAENAFRMIIKAWDTQSNKEITSVSGAKKGDYEVWDLSSSGKYLAYATNNTIHIKSLRDNVAEIILTGHSPEGRIDVLKFSSDESMLFSGGTDRTVKIWSIADKTLLTDLPQFGMVRSILISPDETLLYIATNDEIISVWGHTLPK